jgi:hypothetical protein
MKPLTIQGVVLVLMLVALPLASLGTATDADWANVAALGVFGLAALVPPVMRFVGDGDGDADEDDDAEETSDADAPEDQEDR